MTKEAKTPRFRCYWKMLTPARAKACALDLEGEWANIKRFCLITAKPRIRRQRGRKGVREQPPSRRRCITPRRRTKWSLAVCARRSGRDRRPGRRRETDVLGGSRWKNWTGSFDSTPATTCSACRPSPAGAKGRRAWTIHHQARWRRRLPASSTPTLSIGFIRAQTIAFDDFVATWRQGARRPGKMRAEGKDYVVRTA